MTHHTDSGYRSTAVDDALAALYRRAERAEDRADTAEALLGEALEALGRAADDLGKAANQFAGIKLGALAVEHNDELFAGKENAARAAHAAARIRAHDAGLLRGDE